MERQAIRNNSYEIVGYVDTYDEDRMDVRDAGGQLVGRVSNGHTYDKNGNMVSWGPNPGALFGELDW
jgi:hypothetical protein